MDKKLMLSVAGAGKTTYIINKICTKYKRGACGRFLGLSCYSETTSILKRTHSA